MVPQCVSVTVYGGSAVKNPPVNAEDGGSIPGWERSPEEGNGNLLQFSCQGDPMDRESWQATDLEDKESQTRLSD